MSPVSKSLSPKADYVGAPAHFKLEQCCQQINDSFGSFGCYLVGSVLDRSDWRDVDVRFILSDDRFEELFPGTGWTPENPHVAIWEFNPRWLLLTIAITEWLRTQTGLPIDFQFQPQTFANEHHKGRRHSIGLRLKTS